MKFTAKQVKELRDIVELYYTGFIANNINADFLTAYEIELLASHGIVVDKKKRGFVEESWKYGMLSEYFKTKGVFDMSFSDMKKQLKSKNWLPLDYRERETLKTVQFKANTDFRHAASRVLRDMDGLILKEDVARLAGKAISQRQGVVEFAAELRRETGKWARDLGMISDFVLHTAHTEGRAAQIERDFGPNPEVFIHVFDQACDHCVKHFLTNGAGSQPKIFRLNKLRQNGSNVGRKVKQWKPVLPAMHPWCTANPEAKIRTMVGDASIATLVEGQQVWTHKFRWRPITQMITRPMDVVAEKLYDIQYIFPTGKIGWLKDITGGHPVLTNDKLWGKVEWLETGDSLYVLGAGKNKVRPVAVEKIVKRVMKQSVMLFNIGVEEDESYFMDNVAVHNCRCELNKLPLAAEWDDEEKRFKTSTKDIDERLKRLVKFTVNVE